MTAIIEKTCNYCNDPAGFACNGCNLVFYCGKDCQRSSWKTKHKDECARDDKAAPPAKKPVDDINSLLLEILGITNSCRLERIVLGLSEDRKKCIIIKTGTGAGYDTELYQYRIEYLEQIEQMIQDIDEHPWKINEFEYPEFRNEELDGSGRNYLVRFEFLIPSPEDLKEYLINLNSVELNKYDIDEIVAAIDSATYLPEYYFDFEW